MTYNSNYIQFFISYKNNGETDFQINIKEGVFLSKLDRFGYLIEFHHLEKVLCNDLNIEQHYKLMASLPMYNNANNNLIIFFCKNESKNERQYIKISEKGEAIFIEKPKTIDSKTSCLENIKHFINNIKMRSKYHERNN
jgi:hypothetical protein